MMKAIWNGVVVAESHDVVQVDDHFFFPLSSVNPHYLRVSHTQTGSFLAERASCFNLKHGSQLYRDAVWYFDHPQCKAKGVFGRVTFSEDVQIVFQPRVSPMQEGGGL